jgi:hypothetical protein
MKTVFGFMLLLVATQSFAAVPPELKAKILKAIDEKCDRIMYLTEEETITHAVRIDQGQTDYYYTTNFSASWYFDGPHPIHTTITVESEELHIFNPAIERFNVLSVEGEACN